MIRKTLKLLLLSQIMLVLALAFNAGLNIGSLKKVYTELVTAKFHGVGVDTRIKIEKGVRLGKRLDKFVGLDQMIAAVSQELPEPSEIVVVMADGKAVGSFDDPEVKDKYDGIGALALHQYNKKNQQRSGDTLHSNGDYITIKEGDQHHLVYPVLDRSETLAGLLIFRFDEAIIDTMVSEVLKQQTTVLSRTALAGVGLLALGLLLINWFNGVSNQRLVETQDRRSFLVVFVVLIGIQVYFSYHSANIFRHENISATKSQVATQALLFKNDLEGKILGRGVPVEKLRGIEKRLAKIVAGSPDIASMQILSLEGKVLNMADETGAISNEKVQGLATSSLTGTDYQSTLNLTGKRGGKSGIHVGYLRTSLSQSEISKKVREIVYDSITIIVLSMMFILELKFFLLFFMSSSKSSNISDGSGSGQPMEPYKFARPAAFLLLFAWALPLSFIPLKMQLLYVPYPGIEKELAMGLPISVEMLCALATALMAGGLTDRHGWHLPFVAGIILAAGGALFSAQAESGLAFIGSRGVAGLGYGLAWMAIQGFIFHNSTETNRSLGYATLVAGIFSGHICGTAVGAMLAERFGYDFVFLISASLMTLPMGFVLIFMSRYMRQPAETEVVADAPVRDLVKLLFNKDFFSIMLLSVVPFSLCQVGLLYYAVPIYLDTLEVSQSSIGRVLMVYGLSVIFIAPQISKFMDRSRLKKKYLVLGGLVGSFGLISLYFISGIGGVLIAVFMLGLSSCLAGPAQPALALKIKMAQKVGRGRSMSIQRAADKFGQMGGPLFVGFLVASVGIEKSVAFTGVTFLLATLVLMVVLRESDQQ